MDLNNICGKHLNPLNPQQERYLRGVSQIVHNRRFEWFGNVIYL